jgi:hypothetical protein
MFHGVPRGDGHTARRRRICPAVGADRDRWRCWCVRLRGSAGAAVADPERFRRGARRDRRPRARHPWGWHSCRQRMLVTERPGGSDWWVRADSASPACLLSRPGGRAACSTWPWTHASARTVSSISATRSPVTTARRGRGRARPLGETTWAPGLSTANGRGPGRTTSHPGWSLRGRPPFVTQENDTRAAQRRPRAAWARSCVSMLTARCRPTTRSSTAPGCCRRSGRTAIATSRPPRSIPRRDSSGP